MDYPSILIRPDRAKKGDNIREACRKFSVFAERFADRMSDVFGHPLFLFFNMAFWMFWILTGREPFPYGELTMLLSMQAIFMSVLILNSSTRKGHEDTLLMREDIDLSNDIHDDISEIHDDIEEIKSLLEHDEQ